MKISEEQWHELHGNLQWEVERDTRWGNGLRIRYWRSPAGLAVKEVFGPPGQMFYELFQAEVICHSNAYDHAILNEAKDSQDQS